LTGGGARSGPRVDLRGPGRACAALGPCVSDRAGTRRRHLLPSFGSSGSCVLPCAMGALPPAPRHFALWANGMTGEKGTAGINGCRQPVCSGFLQRFRPDPLQPKGHGPAAMLLEKSEKCQGSGDSVPGHGPSSCDRSTRKPDEPFFSSASSRNCEDRRNRRSAPPGRGRSWRGSLPRSGLRFERERGVRLRDGTFCWGVQRPSMPAAPMRQTPDSSVGIRIRSIPGSREEPNFLVHAFAHDACSHLAVRPSPALSNHPDSKPDSAFWRLS